FLKYFNRPSDEDIDATYQEEADVAVRRGYKKLGIDPDMALELDPIVIHGPMVDKIGHLPAIRRGRDGKVRSSNHEMIVLFSVFNKCTFIMSNTLLLMMNVLK